MIFQTSLKMPPIFVLHATIREVGRTYLMCSGPSIFLGCLNGFSFVFWQNLCMHIRDSESHYYKEPTILDKQCCMVAMRNSAIGK